MSTQRYTKSLKSCDQFIHAIEETYTNWQNSDVSYQARLKNLLSKIPSRLISTIALRIILDNIHETPSVAHLAGKIGRTLAHEVGDFLLPESTAIGSLMLVIVSAATKLYSIRSDKVRPRKKYYKYLEELSRKPLIYIPNDKISHDVLITVGGLNNPPEISDTVRQAIINLNSCKYSINQDVLSVAEQIYDPTDPLSVRILATAKACNDFYFKHVIDFRGRIYTKSPVLTPQGCSLSRGLLKFSEGKEKDDKWWAVHVANVFGVRGSYDDRINWVNQNKNLLSSIAKNPFTYTEWMHAKSPWEFLAACIEDYQNDQLSSIPIRVDGSTNALQILCLLTKDESSAYQTNVKDSDKPNDIYQLIADRVKCGVELTRDVCKPVVMTMLYGATEYSLQKEIKAKYPTLRNRERREIVRAIKKELNALFPRIIKYLDYLNSVDIQKWSTYSGCVVDPFYYKPYYKTINIKSDLFRECIPASYRTNEIDRNRTRTSFIPNLIHSIDASCAHIIASSLPNISLISIHDCFATHSCDMDTLQSTIRQAYYEVCKHNPFRNEDIEGSLDTSCVLESKYFFS